MVAITAGSVDGYIRIDTKLNESGFNKGVSKMSSGFAKLGQFFKTFAKGLSIGLLLIFGVALRQIFSSIRESIASLINTNLKGTQLAKDIDGLKGKFTELKFSIAAAFLPIIQFAIPYLKTLLDWLIQSWNRIAMITAAFTGQKEVLQVIAGSAAELAQNTEDAEKAALGSLAAWDKINVLQPKDTGAGMSTSDLPQVLTQTVPITDDILKQVQEIKDIIAEWWADPLGMLQKNWGNIAAWFKTNVIDPIINWMLDIADGSPILQGLLTTFINPLAIGVFVFISNTLKAFKELWAVITDDSMTVPEKIKAIWDIFVTWLKAVILDQLIQGFRNVWDDIVVVFNNIKNTIIEKLLEAKDKGLEIWNNVTEWFKSHVLDPLRDAFNGVWDGLRTKAINAKDAITSAWLGVVEWFRAHVLDPLRNGFDIALDSIRESFSDIFIGIRDIVRGVINNIIGFVNTMIDAIIGGINAVIDAANSVGSLIPGFSFINNVAPPQIPQLATGAVIPPNARFAAILGDNKKENEILAPESALRRIMEEVLQGAGGSEITVNMPVYLDSEKIYDGQKKVQTRRGPSLISSGVTS